MSAPKTALTADEPISIDGAAAKRRLDKRAILIEGRALIALVLIIAFFSILAATMGRNYLTTGNLIVMTRHVAINAIIALGMLLVILTGGIDLSVGSIVALSGVVAGALLEGWKLSIFDVVVVPRVWVVIIIALGIGTLAGFLNGVVVTWLKVPPFVATLGMMNIARGAAMLIAGGTTFNKTQGWPEYHSQGFWRVGVGRILGVPMGIWVMIAIAVAAFALLALTPFGRWVYAVGGNARAAELSGVPVKKVTCWVYVLSGFAAAAVGLIIASELTSATPEIGKAYELNAIAAVVIGGTALSGGRGNVRGTLIGAFVIGFLSDGLVTVGVSTFWQQVIQGLVVIGAVALDQFQQRTRPSSGASAKTAAKQPPLTDGLGPAASTKPTTPTSSR